MSVIGNDTLKTRRTLTVDGKAYGLRPRRRGEGGRARRRVPRLHRSQRSSVLLENLVRLEATAALSRSKASIKARGSWLSSTSSERELAVRPARVGMLDLPGVPAVFYLYAMRQAMVDLGGDPKKIDPLSPVDPGHRPFGADRQFRQCRRLCRQRQDRVRAQRRTLSFPALGPGFVRESFRLPGAARPRHLHHPGQPRISARRWSWTTDEDGKDDRLSRRPWSAPTATRRWSMVFPCLAGVSAASRPRRRCSGSRCRC